MNTYLHATETKNGRIVQEWVQQYIREEMEELFSAVERAALNEGAIVTKGGCSYVDMMVAARKVRAA